MQKCLRWVSNPRPWDYETHALPTAPQRLCSAIGTAARLLPSDAIPTPPCGRGGAKKRGAGRIELPTSPTRTENHATRPCTLEPLRKVLDPGIEPGTYCVLGSRHNQLDQPSIEICNPGGTRTPSLEIRSLTPYPLGHEDSSSTAFQSPPNTRVIPRV